MSDVDLTPDDVSVEADFGPDGNVLVTVSIDIGLLHDLVDAIEAAEADGETDEVDAVTDALASYLGGSVLIAADDLLGEVLDRDGSVAAEWQAVVAAVEELTDGD